MSGIWCSMSKIREKNRINFTITHKLFCRFNSGFGCLSGFFFFLIHVEGWVSRVIYIYSSLDDKVFSKMFRERLLYTIRLCLSKIWCDNQCNLILHFPVTQILMSKKLSMSDLNWYKNTQILNLKCSATSSDKIKESVWNTWIALVQDKWKNQ